jgi:hypothetical protein
LKRRQNQLRTHPRLLPGLSPAQTAGDHQVQDEKQIVVSRRGVKGENDAFADAADGPHRATVDRVDGRIDGAEQEGAEKIQTLEALAGDVPRQRLDVDNDVRQLRQSIFFEPVDDLLARPVMIVVEVQDDRVERQALVASHRTAAPHVFEAVEQAIHSRTDRVRFLRIARQRIRAFVRRAERARATLVRKVFAKGLAGPASGAGGDGLGELELIFARHLMHPEPPRSLHSTPLAREAHLFETDRRSLA